MDAGNGTMSEVSLIAVGDAKGHGLYVDDTSLVTALAALRAKNLPAHITHADANGDRMLMQVGFFTEFYIDERKLKAKRFTALESFRSDEPEKFNRLFDLALNIPDAFGLSLVFEANIVMVMQDGSEIPVAEYKGKGAIREEPSVRFVDIQSADFVDAPAANEEGLFSIKHTKNMEDEITNKLSEEELALPTEESEEDATKEDEAIPEEEIDKEDDELMGIKASIEGHAERLGALEDGIATLTEQLGSSEGEKETAEAELAKAKKTIITLSKALDGAEPLTGNFATSENDGESVIEQFTSGSANQQSIWTENKVNILKHHDALRRAKTDG